MLDLRVGADKVASFPPEDATSYNESDAGFEISEHNLMRFVPENQEFMNNVSL